MINFNPRDVCGTEVFKKMEALLEGRDLMQEVGKLFRADGSMDLEAELHVPYDWYDLADDVRRVMDRCGVRKASIIGFSTGGGIAQVAMCRLKERLSSAVLCSSSFELLPSDAPFENPRLQELMAAAASVAPDASTEERVKALLPSMMAMFEVSEQGRVASAAPEGHRSGRGEGLGGRVRGHEPLLHAGLGRASRRLTSSTWGGSR